MNDYVIFAILVPNIILGVGILLRNPTHPLNRLYAAFVAALSIWMVSNNLENEPSIVGEGLLPFFLRVDFFSGVFTFYFWFRFISVLVESKIEHVEYRWARYFLFVASTLLASSAFLHSSLVSNVFFDGEVIRFSDGVLFPWYAALLCTLMGGGVILLLTGRRKAKNEGRDVLVHQIDLVILGSAISLVIALLTNLPQAYFHIPLALSRIGIYGMVLTVVFTGYAMVQAKLFEMRVLVIRSLLYLLFTLLFSAAIVTFVFYMSVVVFDNEFDSRVLLISILISIVATMSLDNLQKWFRRITDRVFFKGRYDARNVLDQVTRAMVQESELHDMGIRLLEILSKEFRIEMISFLFFPKGKDEHEWLAKGFPHKMPSELETAFRSGLLSGNIITDELHEDEVKSVLLSQSIDAVFLIKDNESPIALLFLGPKLSGEPLHEEDVSFLKLLTSEIAIGIRNAQSYTALRKLSAELEQRVLDRTRELEESQAKALAKAQEVVRLKDEFVFLAAHELRTPITAIRGFLELTTDEMDKFPKDIQDNLLAISGASDHLNQMISDLLEIARSENGTASLAAKPTEFKPILDQVLAGLSSLIAEKDIALTVQMSPLPPVLCDTSKTREVLINLIGNAIKYNREHGIIEITVYCPPGERFMMFEVRDNGYGIPKDQQAKIFQKFFRAVSKKTEDILGTGLGLFITRMLVERMGGKINFTSSGEMGTTFSFTLPLA